MNDFYQGYQDFYAEREPAQPNNELYMRGFYLAESEWDSSFIEPAYPHLT